MKIKWSRWESVNNKCQKVESTFRLYDAACLFKKELPHFIIHDFIKVRQSRYFKGCREGLTDGTVLVQVDFSENYTAMFQNEVQSAHWNPKQISVFTAVAWICGSKVFSYALVSNCLEHDKFAVHTFMGILFTDINPYQVTKINTFCWSRGYIL